MFCLSDMYWDRLSLETRAVQASLQQDRRRCCHRPRIRHCPSRLSQLAPKTAFAERMFFGSSAPGSPSTGDPKRDLSSSSTLEKQVCQPSLKDFEPSCASPAIPMLGSPSSWSHTRLQTPREGGSCPVVPSKPAKTGERKGR